MYEPPLKKRMIWSEDKYEYKIKLWYVNGSTNEKYWELDYRHTRLSKSQVCKESGHVMDIYIYVHVYKFDLMCLTELVL